MGKSFRFLDDLLVLNSVFHMKNDRDICVTNEKSSKIWLSLTFRDVAYHSVKWVWKLDHLFLKVAEMVNTEPQEMVSKAIWQPLKAVLREPL